jgi:outer membrane lipoprotein-sorting protein
MNATRLPGTARRGVGSTILLLCGAAWLLLPASVEAAERDAATFADEPAAHAAYNRMIEAMHQARTLSYTSRYECEDWGVRTSHTFRLWLKKPNFFRMETRWTTGELEGILIGDGTRLWIHWPKGRPQWEYVAESEADRKTRFT